MSDEKDSVILQLIKEMRDEQREHTKLSASHREETVKWQTQADARTERIEIDLREHKEGVIQNRQVLQIQDKRIEDLERPIKASVYLRKKYMRVAGIISITLTVIIALAKVLELF